MLKDLINRTLLFALLISCFQISTAEEIPVLIEWYLCNDTCSSVPFQRSTQAFYPDGDTIRRSATCYNGIDSEIVYDSSNYSRSYENVTTTKKLDSLIRIVKISRKYDIHDSIITQMRMVYNKWNNTFDTSERINWSNSYDVRGNLIKKEKFINGRLENTNEYVYDANNKLSSDTNRNSTSALVRVYTYNVHGKLISNTRTNYNTVDSLTSCGLDSFEFDNEQRMYRWARYSKMNISSDWILNLVDTFSYNASDNINEATRFYYRTDGRWLNSHLIWEYDALGHLTTRTNRHIDDTSSQWRNVSREIYTYTLDNLSSTVHQTWSTSTNGWINSSSYKYYYAPTKIKNQIKSRIPIKGELTKRKYYNLNGQLIWKRKTNNTNLCIVKNGNGKIQKIIEFK